jgi:hypothetical protein
MHSPYVTTECGGKIVVDVDCVNAWKERAVACPEETMTEDAHKTRPPKQLVARFI